MIHAGRVGEKLRTRILSLIEEKVGEKTRKSGFSLLD